MPISYPHVGRHRSAVDASRSHRIAGVPRRADGNEHHPLHRPARHPRPGPDERHQRASAPGRHPVVRHFNPAHAAGRRRSRSAGAHAAAHRQEDAAASLPRAALQSQETRQLSSTIVILIKYFLENLINYCYNC